MDGHVAGRRPAKVWRGHADYIRRARGSVFTGLIEDVGVVESISTTPAGRELRIRSRFESLADGESIAVNGACLTVVAHGAGWFSVSAVVTTLGRTTIGDWNVGRRLNLERALVAGGRF